MSSHTTESKTKTDENMQKNSDSDMNLTRREAIVSAAAAGAVTSVASNGVMGHTDNDQLTYDNTGWEDGEGGFYFQYHDAEIDFFGLSSDITVTINHEEMDDEEITTTIEFKINGEDYEKVVEATKPTDHINGVTFTADNFWGEEEQDYDLGTGTNMIDDDYKNITIDPPEPGDPRGEQLAVVNDFAIRFHSISSDGTVAESEELEFWMGVGVPLGFGQYFGANFGEDHVEAWPSDWYNGNDN